MIACVRHGIVVAADCDCNARRLTSIIVKLHKRVLMYDTLCAVSCDVTLKRETVPTLTSSISTSRWCVHPWTLFHLSQDCRCHQSKMINLWQRLLLPLAALVCWMLCHDLHSHSHSDQSPTHTTKVEVVVVEVRAEHAEAWWWKERSRSLNLNRRSQFSFFTTLFALYLSSHTHTVTSHHYEYEKIITTTT